MTDRLTRGDDAGLAWDHDLFESVMRRFPSFGDTYEAVGGVLDVGGMVLQQLVEDMFRVH